MKNLFLVALVFTTNIPSLVYCMDQKLEREEDVSEKVISGKHILLSQEELNKKPWVHVKIINPQNTSPITVALGKVIGSRVFDACFSTKAEVQLNLVKNEYYCCGEREVIPLHKLVGVYSPGSFPVGPLHQKPNEHSYIFGYVIGWDVAPGNVQQVIVQTYTDPLGESCCYNIGRDWIAIHNPTKAAEQVAKIEALVKEEEEALAQAKKEEKKDNKKKEEAQK